MENLYLLQYNNYYNRIVRKEETLSDYLPYQVGVTLTRVNFNPNDFVHAEQIINWDPSYEIPDYLVVTDESNNILNTWFITTAQRTRGGQLRLQLIRDVMADYRDEILNSTAYIKRAVLPSSNPLIYNSEGMNFNQIKKWEDQLYDKTGKAWIVGYVPLNVTNNLKNASINFSGDEVPLTNYSELLGYSRNTIQVVAGIPTIDIDVTVNPTSSSRYYKKYTYHISPGNPTLMTKEEQVGTATRTYFAQTETAYGKVAQSFTEYFTGEGENLKYFISDYNENVYIENPYIQYSGKIVKDTSTGKFYRVSVRASGNGGARIITRQDGGASNALFENVKELIEGNEYISTFNSQLYRLYFNYNYINWSLSLTEISYGDVKVELANHSHPKLQDAPYYMFCMKYTPKNYQLAMQLNLENQNNILDIQLLPYCPAQDYFYDSGTYKLPPSQTTGAGEYLYEPIKDGSGATIDYLLWCKNSVFTFDIPYAIEMERSIKTEVECNMYRLCSPNGNGMFEFNLAKNGGLLSFNVDCTYRPFDPYIHINPNFGNLYGKDFNDFRGLVLNGDFSIPAINDSWIQYTINNKNFQNIFNREIQSLELGNRIGHAQDIVSAVVSAITGGATFGGGIGLATGNVGAGLGAGIGGGLASLGAGIADVYFNEKLRQDQMDLKKDLFTYNLQNIQAIPQSVAKTGCLTNNNKLVPYLEFYTCTSEERTILERKIKYTGMTVGALGKISDYVAVGSGVDNPQYIEADIIEIGLNVNYNITMEIVKEMQGGVRIA